VNTLPSTRALIHDATHGHKAEETLSVVTTAQMPGAGRNADGLRYVHVFDRLEERGLLQALQRLPALSHRPVGQLPRL